MKGRGDGGERDRRGKRRRKGEGGGKGEGRENKIVAKYTLKRTKLHHFLTIFCGHAPKPP